MADQFDENPVNEGDFPQSPSPDMADADIRISNTGQRVRAIIVALIAIGGAIGALVWWQGRKAEIAAHEKVKEDFQKAHTAGYKDFWIASKIDVKELKSNEELDIEFKKIIKDQPVRYGKYIKEKVLPIMDDALPMYKGITVPSEYTEEMSNMVAAAEQFRDAWSTFADELLKFEDFLKAKKKLDEVANSWLGAQQYKDDKYTKKAVRYFNLLDCVLPEKDIEELETMDINFTVKESCAKADAKTEWFGRTAFECFPRLLEDEGKPSEAYEKALAKSRKAERMDHASKFGIEDCLESSRDFYESSIIEGIARAWADYVKAQNELLAAIDNSLKALK